MFSGIVLLVLSSVLLITALAVWLDDPHGSPIFKQIRCSRDGRMFKMYKFRFMYRVRRKKLEELLQNNEMVALLSKSRMVPELRG